MPKINLWKNFTLFLVLHDIQGQDHPGDDPHCFQQMPKSVFVQDSVRYESLAEIQESLWCTEAADVFMKIERDVAADDKVDAFKVKERPPTDIQCWHYEMLCQIRTESFRGLIKISACWQPEAGILWCSCRLTKCNRESKSKYLPADDRGWQPAEN